MVFYTFILFIVFRYQGESAYVYVLILINPIFIILPIAFCIIFFCFRKKFDYMTQKNSQKIENLEEK